MYNNTIEYRNGFWFFQTVEPIRFDEIPGIMDDAGTFQEVLRGVVLIRKPGGWWDEWEMGFSPKRK